MIDRAALLSDLQSLLKKLEADLLERTDSDEVPEVGEWLRAEYQQAKDAERTAHTFKQWLDDFITQVAAAWVLSCVFARFLEDNELVDPPRISGPGSRLDRARDEHTLFFQDSERAKLTDREYLLDIFDGLAKSAAGKELFGEHNPMNALPNWLGPDAAGDLLRFFQKIDSDSGQLVHDFTDPEWNTRFLGDLYQDLSEKARKKYALLQTPDFVEEFILDRTLEPALDEFGLDAPAIEGRDGKPITKPGFRMIDPACGSGHFLLGSFPRIMERWQRKEPRTNIRELVQRSLDSIHGVDINPFAIAIARFRLLLAAFKACGIKQLKDAPAFTFNLACGDSLYHGRQQQMMLGDWTDESHYFRTEDVELLRSILLEGTFHAVVANPPYITVKDKAANRAYRMLYDTCHRKYSLASPFTERIFGLGVQENGVNRAGFNGQITTNSFMKREFGKKLIEDFFPSVDLTHVIDSSGACIPGHNGHKGGTPTTILLGRSRKPTGLHVRTLRSNNGEAFLDELSTPGPCWRAIANGIDLPGTTDHYVSVLDVPRGTYSKFPWSLGGGGASELLHVLTTANQRKLDQVIEAIGYAANIGEDDAFIQPDPSCFQRQRIVGYRSFPIRGRIRDYGFLDMPVALYPYDECGQFASPANSERYYWRLRSVLRNVLFHGETHEQRGLNWREYAIVVSDKANRNEGLLYSFFGTHNHFSFDNAGYVCNKSSPGVFLAADSSISYHSLCCVLSSSVACFLLKQICHCKGGGGTDADAWERFYEMNATKVKTLAIPVELPDALQTEQLTLLARQRNSCSPWTCTERMPAATRLKSLLENGRVESRATAHRLIHLQEDLDWECYLRYGLLEESLTYHGDSPVSVQLGERAFEIVLARKMAAGEVQTTWFERHGSTPIAEIPDEWPDDYKQLVQRRIEVIESNPNIALIEQPEYKRRWNTEPWESQVERALKSWLLDRLEGYFDFDGRMNDEGTPTSKIEISLTSVVKLADIARQDRQFMEVSEIYRDDPAFDVQNLVEELVKGEHVPLLPVLRYKANGLRNRVEWEKTWELQRLEDKLRAEQSVDLSDYELTNDQREAITKWQQDTPANQKADDRNLDRILSIPVPPKYKSSDFISTGGARYWALRGKLDVPKERWVSFPHCEGPDGTLVIAWAGYDHLQLAQAISAYYVDVQERLGGRDDPRLVPLLAGIIELLPWLKQWHHDIDPEYNQRMDEVFEGFVTEEAKGLGMTTDEIKAWQPPKKAGGKRAKRTKKVSK